MRYKAKSLDMKYRLQWPTRSIKSLTVSDWTSIQSMVPSYLIGSAIEGKTPGQWNIGHSDLQNYEVTCSVKLNKSPKYDACLLARARDIKKNL